MSENTVSPGRTPSTVESGDGKVLTVPEGWALLPPGDAALTRRVKAAGDHWIVQEKRGRRTFSKGVWAAASTIDRLRAELDAERSTESHAKRKEADARRREKAQAEYVEDFFGAVMTFLDFHSDRADLAKQMAQAATDITKAMSISSSELPVTVRLMKNSSCIGPTTVSKDCGRDRKRCFWRRSKSMGNKCLGFSFWERRMNNLFADLPSSNSRRMGQMPCR